MKGIAGCLLLCVHCFLVSGDGDSYLVDRLENLVLREGVLGACYRLMCVELIKCTCICVKYKFVALHAPLFCLQLEATLAAITPNLPNLPNLTLYSGLHTFLLVAVCLCHYKC